MAAPSVGFDIGSLKTMVVLDDGEIVRTQTGSTSHYTVVSFAGKKRSYGEEALSLQGNENTLTLFTKLLDVSYDEFKNIPYMFNSRNSSIFAYDNLGRLQLKINHHHDKESTIYPTSLLSMFLSNILKDVKDTITRVANHNGTEITDFNFPLCFALTPNFNKNLSESFLNACDILNIPRERVFLYQSSDCLLSSYHRKILALGGPKEVGLLGKYVMIVDIGHLFTNIIVVQYPENYEGDAEPKKIDVQFDSDLGAYHFDLKIFDYFAKQVEEKYKEKIVFNSKRGTRLLAGCERIRKLLSQLNEASITIEHLLEDTDIKFSLTRDELLAISSELTERLLSYFNKAIAAIPANEDGTKPTIEALELNGGGSRMPIIHKLIFQAIGTTLPIGAKLDEGSIALGATLLYKKSLENKENVYTPAEVEKPLGLTSDEIVKEQETQLNMTNLDQAEILHQAAYNKLESYILELRNIPRRKHGELVNYSALSAILDEFEGWLWDFGSEVSTAELDEKYSAIDQQIKPICEKYFAAIEEDKIKMEKQLQEEAERAAKEKELLGEDDDHDNRKLKKADRMRLVVKNKDEGTELFKGGNYRPAAARYHKALTHAAKFFDLGPDDEIEVNALKVTLYSNLAACYVKLDNWDNVLRNCDEALKIDPNSTKALFRRSSYYEHKKDWDNALKDLKKCSELNPEDKLIAKAVERVRKEIQKEKDKEKKMWGNAFGK